MADAANPNTTKAKPTIERETHQLRSEDVRRLWNLKPLPGEAFRFWKELCAALNLDHTTVLCGPGYQFTALPMGHGKHWCWPRALKIDARPVYKDFSREL